MLLDFIEGFDAVAERPGEGGNMGFGTREREHALQEFQSFVSDYDLTDTRIAGKVEHTHNVTDLCEYIAREVGLSEEDVNLAWLCGLLHDVGRFEQLKHWSTFNDAQSVDHARLGADMLVANSCELLNRFVSDDEWKRIVEAVVRFHGAFRLPDDLTGRARTLCEIVRDADKVDIVRVFSLSDCFSILGLTTDEFMRGEISDAAMVGFGERRCLNRTDRQGNLDGLVGVVCLAFEIVNRPALDELARLGYLDNLLRLPFGLEPNFSNPDTQRKWSTIVESYGYHPEFN